MLYYVYAVTVPAGLAEGSTRTPMEFIGTASNAVDEDDAIEQVARKDGRYLAISRAFLIRPGRIRTVKMRAEIEG